MLLSVDDLDVFKGVNLKILAMGKLLESHHMAGECSFDTNLESSSWARSVCV